jgi:hypothetical protein
VQTGIKRPRDIIDYLPIFVGPSLERWSTLEYWLILTIANAKNMSDVLKALSHASNTSYVVLYEFFDCGIPSKAADISMIFASILNDKRYSATIRNTDISDSTNEIIRNVDDHNDNIDMIALEEELNNSNDSEEIIEDY